MVVVAARTAAVADFTAVEDPAAEGRPAADHTPAGHFPAGYLPAARADFAAAIQASLDSAPALHRDLTSAAELPHLMAAHCPATEAIGVAVMATEVATMAVRVST